MRDVIICRANKDDIQNILPLLAQLGYPISPEELEKRFKTFINLDGYGVAVACCNSQIVGLVAWSKSKLFVSDKTRIHIEALVIDKHCQRQGIGKKLMMFVEEFALAFSPVIIDLTSGLRRSRSGAHEFYKSLGYHNEGFMTKLYLRKEI